MQTLPQALVVRLAGRAEWARLVSAVAALPGEP